MGDPRDPHQNEVQFKHISPIIFFCYLKDLQVHNVSRFERFEPADFGEGSPQNRAANVQVLWSHKPDKYILKFQQIKAISSKTLENTIPRFTDLVS